MYIFALPVCQPYFTGASLCIRSFPSESSPVFLYSLFWSACVVRHSQARGSVDELWERPLFWADQIFPVAPNEETRKEQLEELKSCPLEPQAPPLYCPVYALKSLHLPLSRKK